MTKSSCLQCRLISSSNVVPSPDGHGPELPMGNTTKEYIDSNSQSFIVILVMVSVLIFILTYCLWGMPWCRYFCRRRMCPCFITADDLTVSSGSATPRTFSSMGAINTSNRNHIRGTPTIILLPHGRMLVVDGSIIAQFQADTQGVDLMELGQSIAWQRHQSTPSIISSETSKDALSPLMPFSRFSPPSYDSLFGNHMAINEAVLYDLPPSYSEINFQLQQLNNAISREFGGSINIDRGCNRTYTSETNLQDSRITGQRSRRFHSADFLECVVDENGSNYPKGGELYVRHLNDSPNVNIRINQMHEQITTEHENEDEIVSCDSTVINIIDETIRFTEDENVTNNISSEQGISDHISLAQVNKIENIDESTEQLAVITRSSTSSNSLEIDETIENIRESRV